MNEFTLWIMAKLLNYMKNHEGCTVVDNIKASDSAKAIIVDSLGFRYEVQLKCIGRLYNNIEDTSHDSKVACLRNAKKYPDFI
jgi:hypothetical protein